MPQISSKSLLLSSPSMQWMIWEITEDLSFFQTFPENWTANKDHKIASQKKLESSAARFCLWSLCQQISKGPWDLKKDEFLFYFYNVPNHRFLTSVQQLLLLCVLGQRIQDGPMPHWYETNLCKVTKFF